MCNLLMLLYLIDVPRVKAFRKKNYRDVQDLSKVELLRIPTPKLRSCGPDKMRNDKMPLIKERPIERAVHQ